MISINHFFLNILKQIRKIYLNSNIYDKKISKVYNNDFFYKPSPHLLFSLIKYHKKKIKIDDFSLDEIWSEKNINKREFKNLNNFNCFIVCYSPLSF